LLIGSIVFVKWLVAFVYAVPSMGHDAPYLLMLPPTLIAAWYGGVGPGLVAATIATLSVNFFFLAPYYDLRADPSTAAHTIVEATQSYLLAAFVATLQAARLRAEIAARRMEGIYAVSSALSGARSVAEVTEVIVHEVVGVLDADGVAAWFLGDDGDLHKVMSVGRGGGPFPGVSAKAERESPFQRIALDSPGPVALSVRSRALVLVENRAELHSRFPQIAAAAEQYAAEGYPVPPALVCAPMAVHEQVIGVLLVAFSHPRRLTSDERAWVKALAQDCGLSAQRARLLETERRARFEAEEATHAKDEFLAGVSNELRAPLTTIIGWARLLRKDKGGDRARYDHGLDVIERSAEAEGRLVADIIEMSQMAARRFKVEVRPVDLNALVRAAVDELRVSAAAWGVELEMDPSESATVIADPARISQVLHYVIPHAFKSTPPGGHVNVRISVGAHRACIEVVDDGSGMDAGELARVFQGFHSEPAGIGERTGNRGLGLAMPIAKHIVEEHRGRLLVTSPGPGRGTKATIELPLAEPLAGLLAVHPARPRNAGHALNGIRVLVIDDDPDGREVLTEMLASEGAVVRPAPSARAALDELTDFSPQVLVCDSQFPDTDHDAALRKLRDRPAPLARIPAVALIDSTNRALVAAAKEAGFDRQLPKPSEPRALIEAISELGSQAAHASPPS
jgi:K+-sensing histidine kinase KdpD/CheY-like chemotaxis protein